MCKVDSIQRAEIYDVRVFLEAKILESGFCHKTEMNEVRYLQRIRIENVWLYIHRCMSEK